MIELNDSNYNTYITPYIRDGLFVLQNMKTRELAYFTADNGVISSEEYYIGAQQDTNVQHVIIKCNRFIENTDLIQATHVYIYFHPFGAMPMRVTLSNDKQYYNENYIYLDWTITSLVTQFTGEINFAICFRSATDPDDEELGTIYWELNSQSASAIIVSSLSNKNTIPTSIDDTYEEYDTWSGEKYTYRSDYNDWPFMAEYVDQTITINEYSGALNVPEYLGLGRAMDHLVTWMYIAIPKTIYDSPITSNWDFYINYTNAKGESGTTKLVKSWEDDGDIGFIYCTWFVPIGATLYAGPVDISVACIHRIGNAIAQSMHSNAATLVVAPSIVSGEMIQILSDDELLAVKINDILPDSLTNLLSPSNSIILNGDIW